MIDVRLLRTDPDAVRAAIARRGQPELLEQVDRAGALDAALREIASQRDDLRRQVNDLSKEVGRLRKAGDTAGADAAMGQSRAVGDKERELAEQAGATETQLRDLLLRIPNLPSAETPDGTGEDDNPVVIGPVGLPAEFADHQKVPHWETGPALGILDNERAVKISGAMFTMLRGQGATLGRALCQLALDRNADAFEEIRPPSLVTSATLTATGQLPKFADDAYAVERDDLWCIPTAEVPLTSIYGDEVLAEAELPVRLMAATPCYRREAGSAPRSAGPCASSPSTATPTTSRRSARRRSSRRPR